MSAIGHVIGIIGWGVMIVGSAVRIVTDLDAGLSAWTVGVTLVLLGFMLRIIELERETFR